MFDNLLKLRFDKKTSNYSFDVQTTSNDVKQFIFSESSQEWQIVHNYGTKNVSIQAYNQSNEIIYPAEVLITDNDITISFNVSISGFVNVMFVNGDVEAMKNPTPTVTSTVTPTVTSTVTPTQSIEPTVTPTVTPTASPVMMAAPLDSYNTGLRAAYSTRQLFSSYSGPLLRVQRSSDSTEQNIGQVAGELDISALSSFVGVGNGTVVTWYDQAGSTNMTGVGTVQIMTAGVLNTIAGTSVPAVYVVGHTSGFTGGPTIGGSTPASVFCRMSHATDGFGTLVTNTPNGDEYAGCYQNGGSNSVAGTVSGSAQYVAGTLSTRAEAYTYTLDKSEILSIAFTTNSWAATPVSMFNYQNIVLNPIASVADWVMYDSFKSETDVINTTEAMQPASRVFDTVTKNGAWTLSESNRRALNASSVSTNATILVPARIPATGNTYLEVEIIAGLTGGIGVSSSLNRPIPGSWWNNLGNWLYYGGDGLVYHNYTNPASGLGSFGVGTIGVLIKNGKLYFRRLGAGSNDGWAPGANIIAETGAHATALTGFFRLMVYDYNASGPGEFRLKLSPSDFVMSLPAGASTLLP